MGLSPEAANVLAALVAKKRRSSFDVRRLAFPAQLKLITSPKRFKVACNSRRSGKSSAAILALLHTATTRPGTRSLFVTLTRQDAKDIAWDELLRFSDEHGLGGVPKISTLTIAFPNGSSIRLTGANTAKEIGKIRGRAYALVVIDEAQLFPSYLRQLIDDVIVPALIDHRGTLMLLGTPPPSITGPFVEAVRSESYAHFEWTIFQNPWIKKKSGKGARQHLSDELKRRKVTVDDPTIQREFFARLVEDPDALAFKYRTDLNDFEVLPPHTASVIGVDVGWSDNDACSVLTFDEEIGDVFLAEERIDAHHTDLQLAVVLKKLIKRWNPLKIVFDVSGNRKSFETVRTILLREGISVAMEPRVVLPTADQVGIVNSNLESGRFRAKADSRFAQDCKLVTWQDGIKGGKLAKEPHSDATKSATYALQAVLPLLPDSIEVPDPDEAESRAKEAAEEARAARLKVAERRARQQDMTSLLSPKDDDDWIEDDEPWSGDGAWG